MLDLEPIDCPVVVDSFTNDAIKPAPACRSGFFIQDGVTVYQGGKGPYDYKLSEVEDWLKKYKGNRRGSLGNRAAEDIPVIHQAYVPLAEVSVRLVICILRYCKK